MTDDHDLDCRVPMEPDCHYWRSDRCLPHLCQWYADEIDQPICPHPVACDHRYGKCLHPTAKAPP